MLFYSIRENMNYYMARFDSVFTMMLLLIGFFIVIYAEIKIKSAYSKYKKIPNNKFISGANAARTILDANGLQNVEICEVKGNLTDHYNPSTKQLSLSTDVYTGSSVAAISVAAHECGHAIQDKENYTFLRIRTALVPVVNFISYMGYIGLIIAIFASVTDLINISILVLIATIIFQLVTLPVEFDASSRAKIELANLKLIDAEELKGVKKVLGAAAMTYVASLLSSVLSLMRLILILNNRRRD